MKKLSILLVLPFLLSGCATMFSDSKDVISITTNDKEASIMIDGQFVGKEKIQYIVPRGKSVVITANKNGCPSHVVQTTKSVNGMTFLNILFWPGFIVDAATGAIQKTDPLNYNISLNCN